MNANIVCWQKPVCGGEQDEYVDQYFMSDSGQEHSTLKTKKLPGFTGPNETTSTPVASQTAKAKFVDKLLQTAGGKDPLGPTIDNSLADTINTVMRSKPFDKDIFKESFNQVTVLVCQRLQSTPPFMTAFLQRPAPRM